MAVEGAWEFKVILLLREQLIDIFYMNQAFSKLCFIQVELQGFNMVPVTSDDNDNGG